MANPTLRSLLYVVNGTFIVPAGVKMVWVTMVGGGGGGTKCNFGIPASSGGFGGGAGEYARKMPVKVTPGQVIPIVLGNGGLPDDVPFNSADAAHPFAGTAYNGGKTSFGSFGVAGGWGASCLGAVATVGPAAGHTFDGGDGGGVGGNPRGPTGTHLHTGGRSVNPAWVGVPTTRWVFGGSGGGGGGATAPANGYDGGPCEGHAGGRGSGGPGYTSIYQFYSSGFRYSLSAGGGASIFGPGADGANYQGSWVESTGRGAPGLPYPTTDDYPEIYGYGHAPPPGSYGAGGGGAAGGVLYCWYGWGGPGLQGACRVEWIETQF